MSGYTVWFSSRSPSRGMRIKDGVNCFSSYETDSDVNGIAEAVINVINNHPEDFFVGQILPCTWKSSDNPSGIGGVRLLRVKQSGEFLDVTDLSLGDEI